MSEENKNHYVNNKDLYERTKQWKKEFDEYQIHNPGKLLKMPDSIAKDVIAIANGLIKRYNFSGYSENWKQDMVADGIEDCIKGLHNFDPEKSTNVYGYINKTCWWAFVRRIKTEKRENASKYRFYLDNAPEETYGEVDEDFMQDMANRVEEFEESIKPKEREYKGPNLLDFME